jgi:peptidyl-tRNA hydrolase
VAPGPAFPDEAGNAYSVVTVRFDAATGKGQLVSQNAPLAIAPVFE